MQTSVSEFADIFWFGVLSFIYFTGPLCVITYYFSLPTRLMPGVTLTSIFRLRPKDIKSGRLLRREFISKSGNLRDRKPRVLFIISQVSCLLRSISIIVGLIGFFGMLILRSH